MRMRAHKKGSLSIALGITFLILALMLTGYNYFLGFSADKASANIYKQLKSNITEFSENPIKFTENSNAQMPLTKFEKYDYIGTLQISSLGLKLPVASRWDYSALRISPCRYTGSVYQDNLIICAHNYNKHFGKLNTLKTGDSVRFTDVSGNEFRFRVSDIETVNPKVPENMTAGNWDLTLFTCNLAGNSRITVRCLKESNLE